MVGASVEAFPRRDQAESPRWQNLAAKHLRNLERNGEQRASHNTGCRRRMCSNLSDMVADRLASDGSCTEARHSSAFRAMEANGTVHAVRSHPAVFWKSLHTP
jgi:hypothetical protein